MNPVPNQVQSEQLPAALRAPQSEWWRTAASLAGLCVVAALFHSTLATWIHFARTYDHYSHLVLIPLISAYVIYLERKEIFREVKTDLVPAAMTACAGLVPIVIAHLYRQSLNENDWLMFQMLGLVILVLALFVGLWGRHSARAARFSLAFLLLSVPLPYWFLDRFIETLRSGSAELTHLMFRLTGVPVLREGYVFILPHRSIAVAKECSGIRSGMAMLVLVILCGHLFLRSPARRVILFAVTLPLLIFKNALRIVVLTLLAEYVDPSFLTGHLHRDGGVVFFATTFAIVAIILHFLRRSEKVLDAKLGSAAAAASQGD